MIEETDSILNQFVEKNMNYHQGTSSENSVKSQIEISTELNDKLYVKAEKFIRLVFYFTQQENILTYEDN